jgi:hypothetical protein
MAEVMADRRDFPWHALTLVAHVSEPGNSTVLIARSSDVSRSGCYVDTLNPLPPGTQINIQLRSGEDVFETLARVVCVCPGLGMGVNWATDVPDQQQRFAVLDRWLQKALELERRSSEPSHGATTRNRMTSLCKNSAFRHGTASQVAEKGFLQEVGALAPT